MKKMQSVMFMFTIISLIAAILVLAGCAGQVQSNSTGTTTTSVDAQSSTPPANPEPTNNVDVKSNTTVDIAMNTTKPAEVQHQETAASVIADGTYDQNVSYSSPGGMDTIEISITVKDDIVTAASITPVKADKTSMKYENAVNAALPDLVVGKRIDQLNIPKQVSGSSLTSKAFKVHVEQLIEQY